MDEQDSHIALTRVIAQITAAIANMQLYSSAHPQIAKYVEKAFHMLEDGLKTRPELTIMLVGDDLVSDNRPLPAESAYVANFVRLLKKKTIERMTFVAGLTKSEFQALVLDIAAASAPVRSWAHIKLGKVELRVKEEQQLAPGAAGGQAGRGALQANDLEQLKELYLNIRKFKKIDIHGINDIVSRFISEFRREINPLSILASVKSAHEYTFTHVTNVGILTMTQAEFLGFQGEHLRHIGVASLLHDVGKLFVSEEILSKPGMLTPEERKIMDAHPVKGARYLVGHDGVPKLAVLAALEHHVKYDGTGYPSIRGGWQPNIASQMIEIADVFDAMRSRRSYQEPHPLEKIIGVLRGGSGKAFNPLLVEHFLQMITR